MLTIITFNPSVLRFIMIIFQKLISKCRLYFCGMQYRALWFRVITASDLNSFNGAIISCLIFFMSYLVLNCCKDLRIPRHLASFK